MHILKRILNYLISTIVAFLCAIVYMRIILGAKPEPSKGLLRIFDWLYDYIFIHVGLIIGSIIVVLYILLDLCYLHKKLESTTYKTINRLFVIIGIAIIVGVVHYMLEKVIDVI